MKIACEQCEIAVSSDLMMGWIHTEPAGEVDTSSFGKAPIDGVFCSITCLMTWFVQNQDNTGVNRNPASSIKEVK